MVIRTCLFMALLALSTVAFAEPDTATIRKQFAAKDATIAELKHEIAQRDATIAKLMTELSAALARRPQPQDTTTGPNSDGTSGMRASSIAHGSYRVYPLCDPALLLDDAGSATTNGNGIDIYEANGTVGQLWTFSTANVVPPGDYNIATIGPYCLEESGPASGARAELQSCNGDIGQSWSITEGSQAGTYEIHPASDSSECLDVAGGPMDGTMVDTAVCNGSSGQQWGGL
jgi:hypothetical protein